MRVFLWLRKLLIVCWLGLVLMGVSGCKAATGSDDSGVVLDSSISSDWVEGRDESEGVVPELFSRLGGFPRVDARRYVVSWQDRPGGKWYNYFFYIRTAKYQVDCDLGNSESSYNPPVCVGVVPVVGRGTKLLLKQSFGTDTNYKTEIEGTGGNNMYIPEQVRYRIRVLPVGYRIHIPYSKEPHVPAENNTDTTCVVADEVTFGCIASNLDDKVPHGFLIDADGTHLF